MKVEFTLNGRPVTVEGEPMERLLDVLREGQRLTGTKEGCGEGECGACTVLLDGEPVLSCLVPLVQCAGRVVETVEGVTADPEAKAILDRFIEEGGTQCGACTPGIVVTAWRLRQGPRQVGPRVDPHRAGRQSLPLHRLRGDPARARRGGAAMTREHREAPR